jgi:hypothetical protein
LSEFWCRMWCLLDQYIELFWLEIFIILQRLPKIWLYFVEIRFARLLIKFMIIFKFCLQLCIFWLFFYFWVIKYLRFSLNLNNCIQYLILFILIISTSRTSIRFPPTPINPTIFNFQQPHTLIFTFQYQLFPFLHNFIPR